MCKTWKMDSRVGVPIGIRLEKPLHESAGSGGLESPKVT